MKRSPASIAECRKLRFKVKAGPVLLAKRHAEGRKIEGMAQFNCVHVREERARRGDKPVEWWLLTTAPVTTLEEALNVARNYTTRWRVEEFHRAWKSGVCNVERSQLRSANAFMRWATIGAAVAARAERLKTTSRTTPHVSALTELTQYEIDAAIILSKTKRFVPGDALTLEEAVGLIAGIGGYTGKSSGGPPGVRVISRALDRVLAAAAALEGAAAFAANTKK
jgi:hypothetical protein